MVDNPFEPKPAGTSIGGTPMEHKETSKPIAGPIPDANNPDMNHPGVMTNIPTGDGGKVRDSSGPSAGRTDPPEDPKEANVSATQSSERKWPEPLDPRKWNQQSNQTTSQKLADQNKPNDPMHPQLQDDNYNPNPVTAGSAEDVKMSAGEYSGDIKVGQFIKVSPLNAADDDYVVGKVVGLDVSGLGRMVYIDESNELKLASFHAEDAEMLYEVPEDKQGKKVFINDDQTYDARELRMERPKNEKQYVEKQRVLRDQTAQSQFNKNLGTR